MERLNQFLSQIKCQTSPPGVTQNDIWAAIATKPCHNKKGNLACSVFILHSVDSFFLFLDILIIFLCDKTSHSRLLSFLSFLANRITTEWSEWWEIKPSKRKDLFIKNSMLLPLFKIRKYWVLNEITPYRIVSTSTIDWIKFLVLLLVDSRVFQIGFQLTS